MVIDRRLSQDDDEASSSSGRCSPLRNRAQSGRSNTISNRGRCLEEAARRRSRPHDRQCFCASEEQPPLPVSIVCLGIVSRLDVRLGPSGGLVQLSLQEPLRREVGQVGGDPDAASVELQQLDVLVGLVVQRMRPSGAPRRVRFRTSQAIGGKAPFGPCPRPGTCPSSARPRSSGGASDGRTRGRGSNPARRP